MHQPEKFPTESEQATSMHEAVFLQDGSLNEALLVNRFGISSEEAMQEVTFGSYKGTVAQMLGDEKCPVGGMVSSAYAERGIEGVAEKFRTLSELDPKFAVTITETTLQRDRLKKK
jgi:hypothetical protein